MKYVYVFLLQIKYYQVNICVYCLTMYRKWFLFFFDNFGRFCSEFFSRINNLLIISYLVVILSLISEEPIEIAK